jgi:hypothetical protein
VRAKSSQRLHAVALVAWGSSFALALSLDDPRLRFIPFILAFGTAQLAAWGGARWAPDSGPRVDRWVIGLGAVARLWALALAPAFSDDVFRYVYEGRVVWFTDLGFPFRVPPADAPAAGVPPVVLDEAWLRINHPSVPTIYPPLAQAVFVAAGGLSLVTGFSGLSILKTTLVAAETAVVTALLKRREHRRGVLYAWWLSPLAIWATAREGHVDMLSACCLAVGAAAFLRGRTRLGHAGFAAAALAKLNGLLALVASVRRAPRALGPALLLLALLGAPLLVAGSEATQGLGAYATRWRSGDGLFSVLARVAEIGLGGDWARVGPWTLTRAQLARALAAGAWVGLVALRLRRPASVSKIPSDAAFVLLVLLLCAPTLHPWYGVWLLPFLALRGGTDHPVALGTLVTALPLLHHAAWLQLEDGVWRDLPSVRAAVHGGAWFALLAENLARRVTPAGQRIVDDVPPDP